MKRNILKIVCAIVCFLLYVSVFFIFLFFHNKPDENADINYSDTVEIESTNESDFMLEEQIISEEDSIIYYCEETIMDKSLFADFLNNKVVASDNVKDSEEVYSRKEFVEFYGENFYIKDLYQKYYENGCEIKGIQIIQIDLDCDEIEELVIIISETISEGMVHVFDMEAEKIYAWEPWECYGQKSTYLEFYENGIIDDGIGHYRQYNSKGEIELVLTDIRDCGKITDGEQEWTYVLTVYENGDLDIQLKYEEYEYALTGVIEITPQAQEIKEQYEAILTEFKDANRDGKRMVNIFLLEDEDILYEYITYKELCE